MANGSIAPLGSSSDEANNISKPSTNEKPSSKCGSGGAANNTNKENAAPVLTSD